MGVSRKITCDHTGTTLEENGVRLRPYLTLKNNLVYQKPDEGYAFLPEPDGVYAFRDADALADWTDARILALGFEPLANPND